VKLERAVKLVGGLSDERTRWAKDVDILKSTGLLLTGNSVLSGGMVAYAGAFTSEYRNKLEDQWIADLKEIELPISEDLSLNRFLGVPVVI